MRWLQGLLTALTVLWSLLIVVVVADHIYYHGQLVARVYLTVYLLLMSVMIWLAARTCLSSSTLLADIPQVPTKLLSSDLRQKASWLKNEIKLHGYYQDPDLDLGSLAQKLDMHTHELSRIINTVLKKSFTDLISGYRVRAAINKMRDPAYDHLTLLGIAYECGFNSQSSFNRIFKQVTGKSPQEYKNEHKKEQSSYNLGKLTDHEQLSLDRSTAPKWSSPKLKRNFMFKNYFKIARRNLSRNKGYAAINIAGLAVGIAVCMLIFIVIQHHTSFDDFHTKKDRVYRLLTEHHMETGAAYTGHDLPFALPERLKAAFPDIEEIAPIFSSHNDQLFVLDDKGDTKKAFNEQQGLFYTTPSFFKMFDLPLLAGSYNTLKDPDHVLLTKAIAEKYFGDWKSAMGKTIKLQMGGYMFEHGNDILKVSGILENPPANTDLQVKIVVSYGTGFTGEFLSRSTDLNETVIGYGCYMLLSAGTPADRFQQQLKAYSHKVKRADNKDIHIAQPLGSVHFDAATGNYSNKAIGHSLINVLWLIGAFILLIACVNFVNLSTAQAVNRAKEVGVRKVLGSNRSQLRWQFMVETFLIVALAMLVAVGVAGIALPSLGQLLQLSLSPNLLIGGRVLSFLLVVSMVVTLLAGLYPSAVLSGANPVNALKSKALARAPGGVSLRRGLVVFQFVIAQALIIATLVIIKQMDHFMGQPLGFDKDAIVNVPFRIDSLTASRLSYLRNGVLAVNGVQAVSYSSNTPIENANDKWSNVKLSGNSNMGDIKAITKFADEKYISTYKLQLVAGRNLKASGLTKEFLVNESLVKSLGFKRPEDILGKEISIWDGVIKCPVIGVVKDFNDRSLKHGLAPLLMATNITMYTQASIKLKTSNIASTLNSVKQVFEQALPDLVYEYRFLDDKIAGFYQQEDQLAGLYKIFAGIAIFLSCLGLYGLASFMAVQRVKEVGIRKVLGAGTGSIVILFSKEFVILVGIAFVIAAPIAWYYMHQWLQAYAYRISISWWLFAAGGLASVLIALLTISSRALMAAMVNPVKSLKNE
ncbi:ABC transporter permease [Mucilaginibacter myungsuensis]